MGARQTLENLSQVANGLTGLLVLAAVVLALLANASAAEKWPLLLGGALGVVLVLAALYAIVEVVTLHVPSPGATGQQFRIGLNGGYSWWNKLAVILERAAGGVLGGLAAWLVAVHQGLFG